MPNDFFRLLTAEITQILTLDAVASAQQVLEHVLMTLARAAQQVGAPDEHVAWEVLRSIRIFRGKAELTLLELGNSVVLGGHTGSFSLLRQTQWVGIELGCRGQPAHALRAHVEVDQATRIVLDLGQRREDLLDLELFVTPLGR